jgi:hypothetical protein
MPGSRWHPKSFEVRQSHAQRTLTISRTLRKSLRAEARVAVKQSREIEAFWRAQHYETSCGRNIQKQARYGIAAARAVVDTISTERWLAASRVREAEACLQSARNISEAMDDNIALAQLQLQYLLEAAHARGLVELPSFEPFHHDQDRLHLPWHDPSHSDDTDGDSDSGSSSLGEYSQESRPCSPGWADDSSDVESMPGFQ